MPRILLPQIEHFRQERFLKISRNQRNHLAIESSPPKKTAGFYWIYTNYSQFDLEQQQGPACNNAVNIGKLAHLHCDLANICNIRTGEFRIVYNGIAGVGTGIRERLGQHFNGGKGTGSLAILRTVLSDLSRWRVSYATLEETEILPHENRANFDEVAKDVERMWRLNYGWPILCTH